MAMQHTEIHQAATLSSFFGTKRLRIWWSVDELPAICNLKKIQMVTVPQDEIGVFPTSIIPFIQQKLRVSCVGNKSNK
jgi:hypothetical protein